LHFLCLVPLAYTFGVRLDMGLMGLWYAAIIYIVLLATAMVWRFRSGVWQRIKL
jgi:multidrug resistance protein, MATE family